MTTEQDLPIPALDEQSQNKLFSRRLFMRAMGWGAAALGLRFSGLAAQTTAFSGIMGETTPARVRFYGHEAVFDAHGVIAPWYTALNGQCDMRIRIAAETLKRYPWTTADKAVAAYPDYLFTSNWSIAADGTITPKHLGDWSNGDLGQRSTSILKGMTEYYRYSGDAAAIAHVTYMGNYLLDFCLTPDDHAWPRFPISVPVKGKPYGKADPAGMIQLDICAAMGEGLLKAYQVTGVQRWLEAAKHWGDLFAKKCRFSDHEAPWPRYVNPEAAPWKADARANTQTGGVTMVLAFLDELIRLGYTGNENNIVKARDAGLRYLNNVLLPRWTADDTWAYYFWDWLNQTQNCSTTADVASYIVRNRERFPNWRNDVRNILLLFLNHSSADTKSGGDVYGGAWAYPESSSCCGRSLWYAPLMVGAVMAEYGLAANDDLMLELAYRQMILQTYDVHETGVTEDNIDGGVIVNDSWLNIAHPWPLLWVQRAIGCLPGKLGASREDHLVFSTAVVSSVVYAKDKISYTTFDAPAQTMAVLRLSFAPAAIIADGVSLPQKADLSVNGYLLEKLPNGDCIVRLRHDGARQVEVTGSGPHTQMCHSSFSFEGGWQSRGNAQDAVSVRTTDQAGASVTIPFEGNQLRVTGEVGPNGGQADVYLDGQLQAAYIDYWNPSVRQQQLLYYKNGLQGGKHVVKIVARGKANPYAAGKEINVGALISCADNQSSHFPAGTGPVSAQRMIFGYTKREDYQDSRGHNWRPATEVVTRLATREDTVEKCWMPPVNHSLDGVADAELYRYGYHADDFWVNCTVGPGTYSLLLRFAVPPQPATQGFDIIVNDHTLVRNFHVAATAGKSKVADLVFHGISPVSGIVRIRFKGQKGAKAFVQALELNETIDRQGLKPVSFSA